MHVTGTCEFSRAGDSRQRPKRTGPIPGLGGRNDGYALTGVHAVALDHLLVQLESQARTLRHLDGAVGGHVELRH